MSGRSNEMTRAKHLEQCMVPSGSSQQVSCYYYCRCCCCCCWMDNEQINKRGAGDRSLLPRASVLVLLSLLSLTFSRAGRGECNRLPLSEDRSASSAGLRALRGQGLGPSQPPCVPSPVQRGRGWGWGAQHKVWLNEETSLPPLGPGQPRAPREARRLLWQPQAQTPPPLPARHNRHRHRGHCWHPGWG